MAFRTNADAAIAREAKFTAVAAEKLARKGYEILSLIAEGANTRVYRARRISGGGEVAVRIYKPPGERKKFHAAKRSPLLFALFRWRLGRGHPNVVRLLGSGAVAIAMDGTRHRLPYAVMELAEGPTLRDLLEGGGLRHMGLPAALEILKGVISGAEYIRGRGLRHGDLEPQNVILTRSPDGRIVPKLIDLAPRMVSRNPRRNDHIKLQMTLASVLIGRWIARKDVRRVDENEAARYWGLPPPAPTELGELCRLVESLGPPGAMFGRATSEFRARFEDAVSRLARKLR